MNWRARFEEVANDCDDVCAVFSAGAFSDGCSGAAQRRNRVCDRDAFGRTVCILSCQNGLQRPSDRILVYGVKAMQRSRVSADFLVAAGFFVMMLPLIPFLVLFDYFLLLSTSMYGISGLLKCGKEGRLSGKAVAMNIVLQFVFCADVLSAVYCCFKTREKADSNE